MTIPRRLVVDRSTPGWYHCVSRCVRQAFLCGGEFEHRREWVRARLMELASVFAADVAAYAVMSNHLHVVLHVAPDRAERWTAEEVAGRWLRLFRSGVGRGRNASTLDAEIRCLAADAARIEVLRSRLSDLSWFMRCLSEWIARRANREDECTGRFWEGRFKCRRLLDERAVIACCVYTDLNPIRAGLADTPESSAFTSIQDRIHAWQHFQKANGLRSQAPGRAASLLSRLDAGQTPRHAEDGIWLAPMGDGSSLDTSSLGIGLDDYLTLVDTTAHMVRSAPPGVVSTELRPILDRLELDADGWSRSMLGLDRRFGTAVGDMVLRTREAARRGGRWIVQVFDVYGAPTVSSASASA